MKAKSELRGNPLYSKVYIEHDRSNAKRDLISNLKAIANVIGYDKVYVRGYMLLCRNASDKNTNRAQHDNADWQEVR